MGIGEVWQGQEGTQPCSRAGLRTQASPATEVRQTAPVAVLEAGDQVKVLQTLVPHLAAAAETRQGLEITSLPHDSQLHPVASPPRVDYSCTHLYVWGRA